MTLTSDLVFVPNYLELFEKQKSVNSQNTPGRQNISLNLSFFAFTKKTNYVREKLKKAEFGEMFLLTHP